MLNMDALAPMLRKLGYDPFANPPKYGEADLKIKENTRDIKKNSEYWKEMSKKYSVRV
jgi:protein-tyrosine sulfotransferase